MIPDRLRISRWSMGAAVSLIAAVFVSACASTGGTQATATVKGYETRSGLWGWESYSIYKVDGTFVDPSFWGSPAATEITIAPGSHRLDVHANFNRSLVGGPLSAYISLTAELVAGRRYRLRGEVVDDKVYIWLMDESSNTYASEKVGWAYGPPRKDPMSTPSVVVPKGEEGK